MEAGKQVVAVALTAGEDADGGQRLPDDAGRGTGPLRLADKSAATEVVIDVFRIRADALTARKDPRNAMKSSARHCGCLAGRVAGVRMPMRHRNWP